MERKEETEQTEFFFQKPILSSSLPGRNTPIPPNFGIMKMFLIRSTSVRLNPVGTKIANTLSLPEKASREELTFNSIIAGSTVNEQLMVNWPIMV